MTRKVERPHYTNAVAITQNEHRTEAVLHFLHQYPTPEVTTFEADGVEVDMQSETGCACGNCGTNMGKANEPNRDCVTSVVMSRESLYQLAGLLNKVIADIESMNA